MDLQFYRFFTRLNNSSNRNNRKPFTQIRWTIWMIKPIKTASHELLTQFENLVTLCQTLC